MAKSPQQHFTRYTGETITIECKRLHARVHTNDRCPLNKGALKTNDRIEYTCNNCTEPYIQSVSTVINKINKGCVYLCIACEKINNPKQQSVQRCNFTKKTKTTIAGRVGYICSNPGCKIPTIGSHSDAKKVLCKGKAAHIVAARPNGPRGDITYTSEMLTSPENGIWLCGDCHTLIDGDPSAYPITLLKKWKNRAENPNSEEDCCCIC
jgi:hypothetical protein